MEFEPMTVGYLKKFLEKNQLPDDAIILVERVEDSYYTPGRGWHESSVFKEGWPYCQEKEIIDKAKSGEYDDREKYPKMNSEKVQLILDSEEHLESCKTQYHRIWCPTTYPHDNNLYLNLHY